MLLNPYLLQLTAAQRRAADMESLDSKIGVLVDQTSSSFKIELKNLSEEMEHKWNDGEGVKAEELRTMKGGVLSAVGDARADLSKLTTEVNSNLSGLETTTNRLEAFLQNVELGLPRVLEILDSYGQDIRKLPGLVTTTSDVLLSANHLQASLDDLKYGLPKVLEVLGLHGEELEKLSRLPTTTDGVLLILNLLQASFYDAELGLPKVVEVLESHGEDIESISDSLSDLDTVLSRIMDEQDDRFTGLLISLSNIVNRLRTMRDLGIDTRDILKDFFSQSMASHAELRARLDSTALDISGISYNSKLALNEVGSVTQSIGRLANQESVEDAISRLRNQSITVNEQSHMVTQIVDDLNALDTKEAQRHTEACTRVAAASTVTKSKMLKSVAQVQLTMADLESFLSQIMLGTLAPQLDKLEGAHRMGTMAISQLGKIGMETTGTISRKIEDLSNGVDGVSR